MSLNDLKLSPASIAALYEQVLVETAGAMPGPASAPVSSAPDTPAQPSILGEFKQKILIVTSYPGERHLPDSPLAFLLSILSACRLGIEDVGILNAGPGESYRHIQSTLKPRVVLLCGVAPQSLGMPLDFPQFQVQPFDNCTFLFSPPLEQIENDKVLKSKLWVCLRKIFNL